MSPNVAAAVLADAVKTDWAALVGMLTCIILTSSILGALITGLLINPKLTKVNERIDLAKEEIVQAMVSKEVFKLYTETDTREHADMKRQLEAIAGRNHR